MEDIGQAGDKRARSSRRLKICAVLFILVVIGFGAFLIFKPTAEPAYKGKPLSEWLAGLECPGAETNTEAATALRAMGKEGALRLVPMLEASDSTVKLKLVDLARKQSLVKIRFTPAPAKHQQAERAFEFLGKDAAAAAAPGLVAILVKRGRETAKFMEDPCNRAARILGFFGSRAIPYLGPALTSEHARVRHQATSVLMMCAFDEDPGTTGEVLKLLADTDPRVRQAAAYVLGKSHRNPPRVIPHLIEALNDQDADTRRQAAFALGLFGRRASNALPALKKASGDPSAKVRNAAVSSIELIEGRSAKDVPAGPEAGAEEG